MRTVNLNLAVSKLNQILAENAAHIALLFFSRTAEAEQQAKPHQGQGERVHDALISHTHKVAVESELPIYWLSEAEQIGDTFGERLAHAYESLFAKGYQKVIAIGNDCPDLDAHDIKQAASLLEDTDWVIGPALDGGLYLLGLSASVYQRSHFLSLAWEKTDLLQSLQSYIALADQSSVSLVYRTDIDDSASLIKCLSRYGSLHPLYWLLSIVFSPSAERFEFSLLSLSNEISTQQALRAPPALI